MKLIFLDIDGVLNKIGTKERIPNYKHGSYVGIDLSILKNLFYILDKTGAKIVLSSSWRLENVLVEEFLFNLNVYKDYFGGITPSFEDQPRGYEIQQFLNQIKKYEDLENFCIIDDIPDMIHLSNCLFLTSPFEGLTREIAEKIVNHFNS